MPTEDLSFVGSAGAHLSGVLHRPDGPVKGSVLLAHCFTCGKDLHTMTRLARGLAREGYVALRFDFTGLGASDGAFSETTVATNVADLSRAALVLIQRGYGPCALVGHSLGGAAVLLAAHRVKTASAVAVIAAPADTDHVHHLFADDIETIRSEGCAVVHIGGRPFPISDRFLDDLTRHRVLDRVAQLGRPLLVLHGPDDEVVPFEHALRIYEAADEPKRLVSLTGADHLLSDRTVADQALAAIVEWLDETT
ncbi:MAG: alpha/beta hydrolase [Acidimicrobiales bacterium]